ncbi:ABC transporter permease [Cohnella terricola]|uniref:ABC transporter permease n=1 Tax=Cohnella terricola TaxID=1289167 RepID=A0A559JG03_9BACL|nr:ABC transporter permease [Cohnella terricola]TVX98795.1 ABC transporter permease [Cohnella terricola]
MFEQEREDRRGFMRALRQTRAAAFRNEIVPYFRYVFQSGFGLFVSAIFFAALIGYADLIKAVPEHWPTKLVGIAALTLAAIRAPLRAYFRPADAVFLLAMESRLLKEYIRPALTNAIVAAALRTVAIFALFAPIYARSAQTADIAASHPPALMGALFAVIAGCNVYGGWMERRLAARTWQRGLRLARWLLTATVVAALLLKPLMWAIPFMLISMAVVALAWRLPAGHALPWERLIEEEAATRRKWMAFLSWFVDVPSEASKPAMRRWIAWAGDLLPWRHRWSWHYLYAKVFLRGETFGAIWRWVLLSALVIIVSGSALADVILYVVSIVVIGLQLSELKRVRFVETAATLPVAPEGRLAAASAIARAAGVSAALLLGLVGILTVGLGAEHETLRLDYWLPSIAFGLLWCGWWMPRRIARYKDEDEW